MIELLWLSLALDVTSSGVHKEMQLSVDFERTRSPRKRTQST